MRFRRTPAPDPVVEKITEGLWPRKVSGEVDMSEQALESLGVRGRGAVDEGPALESLRVIR